jgi:hypothetical protein
MDFKEFLTYGTSAAALMVASTSAANALVVQQTLTPSAYTYLGGPAFNGQFDIRSLLTPASSFNQPYDVVSATVTAYGYSPVQATSQTVSPYSQYTQTGTTSRTVYYSYSYSCGWGATCTGYGSYTVNDVTETRYNTVTNRDPIADTIHLDVGSDSFSGTVSEFVANQGSSSPVFDGQSGTETGRYTYYYSITSFVTDFLYGNLSAGGALTAPALADLAQDGILPFSVDASIGQFYLNAAVLTVTLNQNPAQADVPEPIPLGPMGTGLFLLMLHRRLAKKRRMRT